MALRTRSEASRMTVCIPSSASGGGSVAGSAWIAIELADSLTTSPGLTSVGSAIGLPLSKVPLREPRSSTKRAAPSRKKRVWQRERN
jgi:hypothetical protein